MSNRLPPVRGAGPACTHPRPSLRRADHRHPRSTAASRISHTRTPVPVDPGRIRVADRHRRAGCVRSVAHIGSKQTVADACVPEHISLINKQDPVSLACAQHDALPRRSWETRLFAQGQPPSTDAPRCRRAGSARRRPAARGLPQAETAYEDLRDTPLSRASGSSHAAHADDNNQNSLDSLAKPVAHQCVIRHHGRARQLF